MTKLDEMKTISKIAKRAVKMYPVLNHMSTVMDLDAVHEKTPLQLAELLKADNFNFAHDVVGIANNLNRETKELENCFSPRFSV